MKALLCVLCLLYGSVASAQVSAVSINDQHPCAVTDRGLLICAAPVVSEQGKKLLQLQHRDTRRMRLALAAHVVLQGVDVAQSMYLSGAGYGAELNPGLAPLVRKPEAFAALKMGIAVGSTYALLRFHADQPRKVLWGTLAINAFYGWVIVSNHGVIERGRAAGRVR